MATTKKSASKKTTKTKTTTKVTKKPVKKVTKTVAKKAPAKKAVVTKKVDNTNAVRHENFSKFLITIIIFLSVVILVGAVAVYSKYYKDGYKKDDSSMMKDYDKKDGYNE